MASTDSEDAALVVRITLGLLYVIHAYCCGPYSELRTALFTLQAPSSWAG